MSKICKYMCGYDGSGRVICPLDPSISSCDLVRDCGDCDYFDRKENEEYLAYVTTLL